MDEEKTDGGLLITGLNCHPDIAKMEFKNTYTANEYEKLINELVEKSGDKLESIKEDFISEVNF